jgi:carboxylate-amine ligase
MLDQIQQASRSRDEVLQRELASLIESLDALIARQDAELKALEAGVQSGRLTGLDGRMIDFESRSEFASAESLDRLLEWTAPVRSEIGVEPAFPGRNASQRQRDALESGRTIREVYADLVRETEATYAPGVAA